MQRSSFWEEEKKKGKINSPLQCKEKHLQVSLEVEDPRQKQKRWEYQFDGCFIMKIFEFPLKCWGEEGGCE